ncbi:hypothetical protein MKK69_04905 [Methylobacterium sp. J-026]|uniref:DUF6894 family protein n=1 Tax=Methylobacterium sp. J-026 TaxID=2836624 RepID=UPI001FBB1896|nr:hypothetical protein [Methylobacterium sp. J-026]MCJ2133407.1 hypothetical protein [Methylobacterium sp. J-026]
MRYFINTANHVTAIDEEGVELPSPSALRDLLRRALTEIMRDEECQTGVDEFTAQAYDDVGRLVMSARASFSITDQ